ncbi:MAG: hypothetical protein KDI42_08270, partial [Gammaproteobacteria bacterium]|nr:hypothetical protein [Gammaproteobacteria bacterium]
LMIAANRKALRVSQSHLELAGQLIHSHGSTPQNIVMLQKWGAERQFQAQGGQISAITLARKPVRTPHWGLIHTFAGALMSAA